MFNGIEHHEIARTISKVGDFELVDKYMKDISSTLTEPKDVVMFYEFIRDNSGRLEFEWREEFISYFPEYENFLPESQDPI
jgi:hypothetical protein